MTSLQRGSLLVYLTVVITSGLASFWRRAILVLAFALSIYFDDLFCGGHFFAGSVLAELSISTEPMRSPAAWSPVPALGPFNRRAKGCAPFLLSGVGLYLASYPIDGAENMAWSRILLHLGNHIFWSCISAIIGPTLMLFRGVF